MGPENPFLCARIRTFAPGGKITKRAAPFEAGLKSICGESTVTSMPLETSVLPGLIATQLTDTSPGGS